MFGLGVSELLVILFLFVLLFGSKKIPELARGIGQGINEFKKSQIEGEEIEKKSSKES